MDAKRSFWKDGGRAGKRFHSGLDVRGGRGYLRGVAVAGDGLGRGRAVGTAEAAARGGFGDDAGLLARLAGNGQSVCGPESVSAVGGSAVCAAGAVAVRRRVRAGVGPDPGRFRVGGGGVAAVGVSASRPEGGCAGCTRRGAFLRIALRARVGPVRRACLGVRRLGALSFPSRTGPIGAERRLCVVRRSHPTQAVSRDIRFSLRLEGTRLAGKPAALGGTGRGERRAVVCAGTGRVRGFPPFAAGASGGTVCLGREPFNPELRGMGGLARAGAGAVRGLRGMFCGSGVARGAGAGSRRFCAAGVGCRAGHNAVARREPRLQAGGVSDGVRDVRCRYRAAARLECALLVGTLLAGSLDLAAAGGETGSVSKQRFRLARRRRGFGLVAGQNNRWIISPPARRCRGGGRAGRRGRRRGSGGRRAGGRLARRRGRSAAGAGRARPSASTSSGPGR